MCGREYLYCYRRSREWGFESIIGLYGAKLLNCSVPHWSLSNFQGEKFGKVKSSGVGVLLLSRHIHDQLTLERRSKVICDPLRSKVLCCNVKVCKVEGLMIQVCSRLSTHLDSYVVTPLEHIASIKDYITRTPLPFFGDTTILYGKSKHNILAYQGKANKH